MKYFLYFSIVCLINLSITAASAKTLFEGYYKLDLNKKHVGYIIQKFEFIKKSQKYQSTYFVKMKHFKTQNIESLKATATKDFKPISYKYSFEEVRKDNSIFKKNIEARFKNLIMTGTIAKGIQKKGVTLVKKPLLLKIQKNNILSTFLIHKMLATGLKNKTNYSYTAISEEDGSLYSGSAKIISQELVNSKKLFKVKNNFKNTSFDSYMDGFGHVYKFNSPVMKLTSTLVKNPDNATTGFTIDAQYLKSLFGNVPLGTSNNFSK